MHGKQLSEEEGGLKKLTEGAITPELRVWLDKNPDRAGQITLEEADELLRLEGANGTLSRLGVETGIELIERRRRLMRRVATIANTEHLDLLEQFVGLLFDKVQPGRG